MIYILDAYNVIHKVRSLEKTLDQKDLLSARLHLIDWCHQLYSNRNDIDRFILVFDGKTHYHDLVHETRSGIQLVFSDTNEEADQRIVKVLEGLKNRAKTVVSDDNYVTNHARAYGSDYMSVSRFESFANDVLSNTTTHPQEKSISKQEAHEITEAYRKELGF